MISNEYHMGRKAGASILHSVRSAEALGGTLCHLGSATSVSGWKVQRVQCGTDLAAQYPRLDWRSLTNYAGDGTEQHQDQVVTRLLYRTGIELTVSLLGKARPPAAAGRIG